MKIGDRATMGRRVQMSDIQRMAYVSGDNNPLHTNEDFAAASRFGGCIAHGLFPLGLVSAVLGTRLPGPGTIYLSQDVKFLAPVRPNDAMVAEVMVTAIDHARSRVVLSTIVTVNGTVVMEGKAEVIAP